jgi:hypothetical protein
MLGRLKNWSLYLVEAYRRQYPDLYKNFIDSLYSGFGKFDIRVTEILCGASFAGLLTLAFISPLILSKKSRHVYSRLH